MLIYRTPDGLARGHGDDVLLLDLPQPARILHGSRRPSRRDESVGRCRRSNEYPDPRRRAARADGHFTRLVLVGANYADRVEEAGMATPTEPMFLLLTEPAVSGPTDDIRLPAQAPSQVDYEGELAIVLTGGEQTFPSLGRGSTSPG